MRQSDPPELARDVIRSSDNRIIKQIRSLRQRKTRETERAFVVEGYRAVSDSIAAGAIPTIVAIREGDERLAANWFSGADIPVRLVDAKLLEGLSDTVTPQGVIGIFPIPRLPLPEISEPLFLVLDQIRDPGNLGTLIRTAAAAGVTALYLTEGTVDPYNPKAVRSAVGAHFRIPIRWLSDDERTHLTTTVPIRIIADAMAEANYDEIDWTGPRVVIVGSEAHGASSAVHALATGTVRIPLANTVESLNAAAAGAIILFEIARQRRILSQAK
jgi:TrmH family RNA methyltransferase